MKIIDSFEIPKSQEFNHLPGLVVILNSRLPSEIASGELAFIQRPDGFVFSIRIDEIKDHLTAHSLFFSDLSIQEVPIGSTVFFEEKPFDV